MTAETLKKDNLDLRSDLVAQLAREDGNNLFVTAATAELVERDLAGERVVVVEARRARPRLCATRCARCRGAGGRRLHGPGLLTDGFLEPEQAGVIDGLATQLAPGGRDLPRRGHPL